MTVQEQIAAAAQRYGVSPALALAVARRESSFNQAARGSSGEVGVMQLMPATAAELGVNPYDLGANIDGGVRYLRQQFDRFGDWGLAVAAYNAGPGNVSRGVIPESTQQYCQAVGLSCPPQRNHEVPDPLAAGFLPAGGGLDLDWTALALMVGVAALGILVLR